MDVLPQIGFVHRGLKLVETRDYNQFIYIAERICGICAMGTSLGYAETVESLMGVEVPKRAGIARHTTSCPYPLTTFCGWCRADAFGFESMFMHCWRFARARARPVRRPPGGGSSCPW